MAFWLGKVYSMFWKSFLKRKEALINESICQDVKKILLNKKWVQNYYKDEILRIKYIQYKRNKCFDIYIQLGTLKS